MILSDEQVKEVREKLEEIQKKLGPYSMDQFTHAINVINANSKRATEILEVLKECEK